MISERVDFDSIPKTPSYEEMIGGLIDDRLSFFHIEGYLKSDKVELFKLTKDGEYIGFYSVERGVVPEIHAFILPEARRHSINALRHIKRVLPGPILTSVYGTHMHVYKVLQRLGFEYLNTEYNAYLKDGVYHNVYFLIKRT